MTNPVEKCGPACSEQHTYTLGTCALSCTEMHGSVAHPAWTVACPHRHCQAPANQPCRRTDGSPSSVVHEERCVALDRHRKTNQPPVDNVPEPTREVLLAEQLSREYDFRGIDELEQEDPERAQEHRDAARILVKWIEECPREERRAAFGRGFDRGKERQKVRTAADMRRLETVVAELRQDRDPDGLRDRISDLEYALRGWDRHMTGRVQPRPDVPADWKAVAAEYLLKLTEAQRELAELKGVQPSNATGRRPS